MANKNIALVHNSETLCYLLSEMLKGKAEVESFQQVGPANVSLTQKRYGLIVASLVLAPGIAYHEDPKIKEIVDQYGNSDRGYVKIAEEIIKRARKGINKETPILAVSDSPSIDFLVGGGKSTKDFALAAGATEYLDLTKQGSGHRLIERINRYLR